MSIFNKIFGSNKDTQIRPDDSSVITAEKNEEPQFVKPKDLPEAVFLIISERGPSIILERTFVNILNDYQVFKAVPAVKNIYLTLISNQYMEKLVQCSNWVLDSMSICNQFVQNFGVKENFARYAIECIGFGLGKIINKPSLSYEPEIESTPIMPGNTHKRVEKNKVDNSNLPQFDPTLDLKFKFPDIVSLFQNQKDGTISLGTILSSTLSQNSNFELPVALGINQSDSQPCVFDLSTLPHLLIAGTTGKGKSVAIHNIIVSLLSKLHPAQLKLMLLDTKGLEFLMYRNLSNHYLVTSFDDYNYSDCIPSKTNEILKRLNLICIEIENRNRLLKNAGARNIISYNKIFCSRKLDPSKGFQYLPYIVVVLDDFGNLMMDEARQSEQLITKIAQKGHLVGIHLIISTQLTTKEIVSPAIRTQFTSRLAFGLMSVYESKLIIRNGDANTISTPGEAIFMTGATQTKIKCAFIDDYQLNSFVSSISNQIGYPNPYLLFDFIQEDKPVVPDRFDPMLAEAARLIVINQSASSSLIQRKFSIGYNRAGQIMDQLEFLGIVGPANGTIPRSILVPDEIQLDRVLSNNNLI